jgi:hypothetical protein
VLGEACQQQPDGLFGPSQLGVAGRQQAAGGRVGRIEVEGPPDGSVRDVVIGAGPTKLPRAVQQGCPGLHGRRRIPVQRVREGIVERDALCRIDVASR